MNLFRRAKQFATSIPAMDQPAFVEVQSYSGAVYHAVATLPGIPFTPSLVLARNTLCGYQDWLPSNTVTEATAQKFNFDSTGRFWRYCANCQAALALLETGQADLTDYPVDKEQDFA